MHGTPAAAARWATPRAVLPNAVWASIRPSPVMTRSARGQPCREIGRVHDQVDPRPQGERPEPVRDGQQPETDAAGRPGPGDIADPRARGRLERIREPRESPIQLRDIGRARALLRTVDGGRPGRTEERVRDIARDREVDECQPWIEPGEIGGRLVTVGLGAERPQQPGAAIGRGAAADPQHDRSCARVDRGADQVPGPGRCRRDRITLCRVDPRQAGRLRHLDVRTRPRRIAKPARPDRPTERVRDGRLLPQPAAGRGHRLERALATVGERTEEDRVVRPGTGPAIRQGPGNRHGRQRPLERIGRDEDRQRSGRHGPTTAVRRVTGAAGSPALRPARRPTGRPLPPAGAARGTRGCGSSAGAPGRPAR